MEWFASAFKVYTGDVAVLEEIEFCLVQRVSCMGAGKGVTRGRRMMQPKVVRGQEDRLSTWRDDAEFT
ncbi:hypothetical protein B2I21_08265 [Chryseobacterium mucoviscidosis]|nr:hypothetical protein B2I21_08265 [Chryseobacterium mucoviscidosis]